MKDREQLWRQYLIAGVANIAIIGTGSCIGWTAATSVTLSSNVTSPLHRRLTSDEEAWIGSLLAVGAMFGPFVGGFLAANIGRKWALISLAIPKLVGWILTLIAHDVSMLYAARLMWGLSAGMSFAISPMYCAEIATNDARGALGSYLQLFSSFGILLMYSIGPYVSYETDSYVGIAVVVVFIAAFIFMPETPFYLLQKGKREEAAKSLSFIRGKSKEGIEDELVIMESEVKSSSENDAKLSDLLERGNIKALYISCTLLFFQQFSGIMVVLFYMTDIFAAAGSGIEAGVATIIIGALQSVSSMVAPLVVDRLGRKILLVVSGAGSAIGLGFLGLYFLLSETGNPIAAQISFVPVSSLVLFIISYSIGLGPIPWAVLGELLPLNVKSFAAPMVTAFNMILCFLTSRYFYVIAGFGMYVAFWLFGFCCLASIFFVLFFVPETKGKSFQEINNILNGTNQITYTGSKPLL